MDSPTDNSQKFVDLLPPVAKAIAIAAGAAWTAVRYSRKYRAGVKDESSALASVYVAGIEKSQDQTETRIKALEARVKELEAALLNAIQAGSERQKQYIEENMALKITVGVLTQKIEMMEGKWEG